MDEEILDNLQVIEDDNEISNFPLFQQKQIGEFIKKVLDDNITTQKAFRDKFNRCLSLFKTLERKKMKKKRIQVTKDDIIMTLQAIDFQEIAQSLENVQLQQSSQENAIQQENLLDQGEEDDELREILYFENSEEEQKDEENNNNNNENIQDNQDQLSEQIDEENNENEQQ
ncbi:unnamed protein product [Paramecium pentaurelia]|uniref:Uncharacterized protein n=1 Tax=Paramecium pentaurelia TaxID=43138 RepID=A0A8S1T424_9CILI|nr:unnamed protein product [Paramecium pentaurelia]